MDISQLRTLGNRELLHLHKTAFLCSRTYPASIVMKSYDWAIAQREQGKCIISGFHSRIEKDVLHYLLKGRQPIIVALARGLKQRVESEFQHAIADNRLLIITPFEASVSRISARNARKRNQIMAELADELFVAFASPNGNLATLIQEQIHPEKPVFTFDIEENALLLKSGAIVY